MRHAPAYPTSPRGAASVLVACFVALTLAPRSDAAAASATTVDHGVVRTVNAVYSHSPVKLHVDVYRAAGAYRKPAIVLVHGGSWSAGAKESWSATAPQLVEAGYVVFAINYRLACPVGAGVRCGYHGKALVDDVRNAVAWVRSEGERFGVDPQRVGALGSSAGAHLALMAAVTGESGLDAPDAVAAWSAPTDLVLAADVAKATQVHNFLHCHYVSCPSHWYALSPNRVLLSGWDKGGVPTYLAHSQGDWVPVEFSHLMAQALGLAAVPYEIDIVPGNRHGADLQPVVEEDTIRFFARYL